ncbi:Uncharacterised protein [Mycobacteroides abscessus]|nr:Uncharacterised protein [Mycobacteroides abscessus]
MSRRVAVSAVYPGDASKDSVSVRVTVPDAASAASRSNDPGSVRSATAVATSGTSAPGCSAPARSSCHVPSGR